MTSIPIDAFGRLSRNGHRSRVRLNMIASVDGADSLDGHSAALGGPVDKALSATLRALADVILVGAAVSPLLAGGDAKRILDGGFAATTATV